MPSQYLFPRNGWFKINGSRVCLEFPNNDTVFVFIDPVTNLPILYCFNNTKAAVKLLETVLYSCVITEVNQNLDCAQKEILKI